MPISFQCPECAKSFKVGDELAGKKARCKCGAAIQVPQPVAPAQQQPVDPLLGPLAANQPAADPLMGSTPPAQPPVDPLMGPQAVDPLAGSISPAAPSATPAGGGGTGMHIGVKVGAGLGGVAVLGLLVWLGISLLGGGAETGPVGETNPVEETGQDVEEQAKPLGEEKPFDVGAIPEMAKQQRTKVEQREDGVFYLTGTDTPYSGKWYEVDSGAYGDATIKNGKLDGTFTWYRPDGSKAGEGTFRDGELVKGSEKWWNSEGEPVDSQAAARQPPVEQPAGKKAPPKNDLSASLGGNRLYFAINGENFWAEFHSDGSCYRGQGAKRSPTKAQWTVRGNRVKVLERSDDDYLVFADLTARPNSEVIFLNSADRAESEGTKGIIVRVEPIPPASDTPDPREMVQGGANALAANDYEAFTKFTCLGMKKEEFKQFMDDNGDGKVIRVWDRAKDDFQAELKTDMHEAFQEILEEAQEEGFDWSRAKVIECEFTDDVKAELVSGSVELSLHLDDCFVTPQGLLMFDAPRGRFEIP